MKEKVSSIAKLIVLSFVFSILTACGGGGGGNSEGIYDPVVDNTDPVVDNTDPFVDNTDPNVEPSPGEPSPVIASISIPDPVEYYSHACETPSIQFVIPVEINNDNTTDFIIHYWCGADVFGVTMTTPTPDALVVQLSQPNGTYRVGNEEVFGSKLIGLGGASRKMKRGDINGDGIDDFAFAMNYEDGRSGEDWHTVTAQPAMLLSTPNGGYEVVNIGFKNWGHAVDIVHNADGTAEVIFVGFVNGVQAFRYVNGQFIDVSNTYPQNAQEWSYGLKTLNENGVTKYIAASAVVSDMVDGKYVVYQRGLHFYKRSGDSWVQLNSFMYDADFTVDYINWSNDLGTATVFTINGEKYIVHGFSGFDIMKGGLSSYGNDLLVAKLESEKDGENRDYVEGETFVQGPPVNIYQFFEFSDTGLTLVESPIINEEIYSNFNFFDAKDINGDNYPDLVSYAYTRPGFDERVEEGGKPTVYINDGFGNLTYKDISHLPVKSGDSEKQSLMYDVNGDGVFDLLLFGSSTFSEGGIIDIHLLRDPIN